MRYRAAAGVGEEAHSRSLPAAALVPMVETGECGDVGTRVDVSGPIVMAHALAELRHGIVAHQHENGFKCGYISAHTL